MTILRNPLVSAGMGLILSIAVGLFMFWRTAGVLVIEAIEAQAKVRADSLPKKEKGWDFWTIEIEKPIPKS